MPYHLSYRPLHPLHVSGPQLQSKMKKPTKGGVYQSDLISIPVIEGAWTL